MIMGFTTNKSVLYTIALLKAHQIKRVIISPGTTNLELTAGLQYDGSFQLYSSVDERSAAYMACGMATECNEPIAITCTEATASREYFAGLTEAYYRKLPILAITGVHRYNQIGNLMPQIIDRSISPADMFVGKYRLPVIKDDEDSYQTQMMINEAILDLKRPDRGPVHIDLPCCNEKYDFSCKELPKVRIVNRFYDTKRLPEIPSDSRVAIFIGAHAIFTNTEVRLIEKFCEKYNSVVFCDHTSGYNGKYAIKAGIISSQRNAYEIFNNIHILIHIGEPTGDGTTMNKLRKVREVWRLSTDGKLRDTFSKLTNVMALSTEAFFNYYIASETMVYSEGNAKTLASEQYNSYYEECNKIKNDLKGKIPELPLSNIYMASRIAPNLPDRSAIHLGVSNTIRAWTLFDFPQSVFSFSNVGCRGIDGALSACVGASIANRDKIHFCVLGDLGFFYDINALGNRDIGSNLRILLINNNGGNVFKHKEAPGYRYFGDETTSQYIAASGHFGNQSRELVKHIAEDLGFKYFTASNKQEFDSACDEFIDPDIDERMVFEVFTKDEDEREAFGLIESMEVGTVNKAKDVAKEAIKKMAGDKGVYAVHKFLKG